MYLICHIAITCNFASRLCYSILCVQMPYGVSCYNLPHAHVTTYPNYITCVKVNFVPNFRYNFFIYVFYVFCFASPLIMLVVVCSVYLLLTTLVVTHKMNIVQVVYTL